MGTYCYVVVFRRVRLGGARRFGAHRGRKGAGAYCGGRPPTACLNSFKTGTFLQASMSVACGDMRSTEWNECHCNSM